MTYTMAEVFTRNCDASINETCCWQWHYKHSPLLPIIYTLEVWFYDTSLTPTYFIEISEPNQRKGSGWIYVCVRGIDVCLSMICQLNFRTLPRLCFFPLHFITIYCWYVSLNLTLRYMSVHNERVVVIGMFHEL